MTTAANCSTFDASAARPINYRGWFIFFLVWLIGLTVAARLALHASDAGSRAGLAIWLLAGYAFYLSLCCAVIPAPTTWIVLLIASNPIAEQLGVGGHPGWRLVVVSTVGAMATSLANLNEYYVLSFLLTFRAIGRIRENRLIRAATRWFSTNPFLVVAAFSLIPVPVDVIRWLAISCRYSRFRFFWANFIGRWIRYAGWCVMAMGLHLTVFQIAVIQTVLVVAALARTAPALVRQIRDSRRPNTLGDMTDDINGNKVTVSS